MLVSKDCKIWQRRHRICVTIGAIWATILLAAVLFLKKSTPLGQYRPEILIVGTVGFCVLMILAEKYGRRRSG